MNQKAYFLSVLVLATIISSCKKEKDPEPIVPGVTYADYGQLKVGNYWIYEQFDVDAAGSATAKNIFDSCYLEKDTVINSINYVKMIKPKPYAMNEKDISFLRDSLHYIINSNGKILFSSEDFTTIFETSYFLAGLEDTVCQIINQMADKDLVIITPAGTFTTSNAKEIYTMYPAWSTAENPRNLHMRYAEDVGVVIETLPFFVSNPVYVERRLVRYHVQ